MRDVHYQRLIQAYHQELSSVLQKCGVDAEKIISWAIFQEQLKIYGRYGIASALLTITFMLAETSEAPRVDDLLEKNAKVSELFTSIKVNAVDRCKERLSDVLLDSIQLGYL